MTHQQQTSLLWYAFAATQLLGAAGLFIMHSPAAILCCFSCVGSLLYATGLLRINRRIKRKVSRWLCCIAGWGTFFGSLGTVIYQVRFA